jgi:hypothetical protein
MAAMLAHSQDSWKIKLNDTLSLNTNQENEIKNIKKISAAEWKKNGYLEINYKESEPNNKWKRSFLFFDKEDNQLLTKNNITSLRIPVALLRKLFAGKKEIRIYTIVSPTDPNMAVRIRRVHLCTLQLP